MYEKFFYLKEKPFHITPDPRFLFLSSKHREAIELMLYGVTARKGFVLLTGEVGTGKTTLCRAILERLPDNIESALILNPIVSENELLKTITEDFGLKVSGDSVKDHLDALNAFLLNVSGAGGNAFIIIDEAQNLTPRTLEMIRLLSNLETEKEKLLQIVMVGQPELNEKLALTGLRQLNQRVIVRYHLAELDRTETEGYIKSRLKVAGATTGLRFTPEALSMIFESSAGVPRLINIICDRALTAAYIDEKRTLGASTVAKALDELEREGYLNNNPAAEQSAPSYARFIPHIAFAAFLIAFAAGFLWGPRILLDTVGWL